METRNDLNLSAQTGLVYGYPVSNATDGGRLVLTFELEVCKQTKSGPKLSRFNVVLFDDVAVRCERVLREGDCITVSGELDEARWENRGTIHSQVRIIARFVQRHGVDL